MNLPAVGHYYWGREVFPSFWKGELAFATFTCLLLQDVGLLIDWLIESLGWGGL